MRVVGRSLLWAWAAIGGALAGTGCGAVAGSAASALAVRFAAGGEYPGKVAYLWPFLACVAGGAVAGACVGVLARARGLRRASAA